MLGCTTRKLLFLSDLLLALSDYRGKLGIICLTLAAHTLISTNSSQANTWQTTFQPNPLGAINIYAFQFQERYIDEDGDEQYRAVWSHKWPDEET